MEKFDAGSEYSDNSKYLLLNMNDTTVYLTAKSRSTVHLRGATTIYVEISGRSRCMNLSSSVAAD